MATVTQQHPERKDSREPPRQRTTTSRPVIGPYPQMDPLGLPAGSEGVGSAQSSKKAFRVQSCDHLHQNIREAWWKCRFPDHDRDSGSESMRWGQESASGPYFEKRGSRASSSSHDAGRKGRGWDTTKPRRGLPHSGDHESTGSRVCSPGRPCYQRGPGPSSGRGAAPPPGREAHPAPRSSGGARQGRQHPRLTCGPPGRGRRRSRTPPGPTRKWAPPLLLGNSCSSAGPAAPSCVPAEPGKGGPARDTPGTRPSSARPLSRRRGGCGGDGGRFPPQPQSPYPAGKRKVTGGRLSLDARGTILTIQRLLLYLKKTKPKLQSSRVSS